VKEYTDQEIIAMMKQVSEGTLDFKRVQDIIEGSKTCFGFFRSVKRFDRFFMFCQVIADDVSERGIAVK
jgi:acetone carboxylase gamma subunit